MLAEKHMEASARMARGPPAFERFPDQAFRYRDWGAFTRHARGDAYPLYTLDTMRNLADHLFDSSTGWASAPERARQVRPCDLLYSTLRPTSAFLHHVHSHIKVRYLLMTDTADEPITLYPAVRTLLESKTLAHWYAVDNEVLDHPKLDSIPLGVTDALEIGKRGALAGARDPWSGGGCPTPCSHCRCSILRVQQPSRRQSSSTPTPPPTSARFVRRRRRASRSG